MVERATLMNSKYRHKYRMLFGTSFATQHFGVHLWRYIYAIRNCLAAWRADQHSDYHLHSHACVLSEDRSAGDSPLVQSGGLPELRSFRENRFFKNSVRTPAHSNLIR